MCEREQDVVRAVRDSQWTDELRAHAAACDGCAEAMLVAAALLADAAAPSPVTDAGLAWWKAELRLKRERAHRALRPVMVAERLAAAAVIAAMAAGGAWLASLSQTAGVAALAGIAVLALSAGSALVVAASRK